MPPPAEQPASRRRSPDRHHHVPARVGDFGMALFLGALAILFAASMLLFLLLRLYSPQAPAAGATTLPWPLWISTLIMLLASVTLQRALAAVQRERQARLRLLLWLTLVLGIVFLMIQGPSLWQLLSEYREAQTTYLEAQRTYNAEQAAARTGEELLLLEARRPGVSPAGMMAVLILIHAAHVVGGLIPLGVVAARAARGRYDHEYHRPVKYLTLYWHFLDGVWLVMFGLLWVVA